jgi:hypothetical protein
MWCEYRKARLGAGRKIRPVTGFLYILTGLTAAFSDLIFVGAMLGMTTPILTLQSALTSGVYSTGPSVLILVGATTALKNRRRSVVCLLTGGAIITGLSLWTVPRIGWLYATQLILIPVTISLAIAGVLVVWIRRQWISAALGSALSAPFLVYGSAYLAYVAIFRAARPSLAAIWIFLPALLVILAFVAAVHFRID